MIALVISLNILIALLGFYAAWQIYCWHLVLANTTRRLDDWQRTAEQLTNPVQQQLLQGRQAAAGGRYWLRWGQQRQRQLRQLWQLLLLLNGLRLGRPKPRLGPASLGAKRRFFQRH